MITCGQLLAELDAPLVEGVDAPDRALREDLVLVERDELAEHGRSERGRARIVVVGRLPAKIRCGTDVSATPSARTSSAVLPNASASVWAKKLAMSRS